MNENEKELIEQEAKRRFPVNSETAEVEFKISTRMYRQFLREYFSAGAEYGYNLAKQSVEREVKKLKEELDVTEKLLAERQRLLDEIPECPLHGSCVPNAILWVKKHKGIEAKELRSNQNQTSK